MFPRRAVAHLLLSSSCALAAVTPAQAQAKDAFVEGLVAFSQTSAGTFGDEGPAVRDALDRMADGLARWDAAVARVETGFAGAITGAAPREAAQMRATIGATYLERGRVADALPHLDAASSLDAAPLQLLRGLGLLRASQPARAAEAFARALASDPGNVTAAMLLLDVAGENGPSKPREMAMTALLDGVSRIAANAGSPSLTLLPLDLLDDASVDEPLFPPSAYAAGVSLLREAKYAQALTSLRSAADGDPLVGEAALATAEARTASTALRNQDARGAVQALLSVPGQQASSEIQRLLGVAYWTLEDYARSAEALRTAVRLNPRNERAFIALSDVLVARGDHAAAREILLQTIAAFPASGQAQWRLGRLSQDGGDEAGALRAFEAAARLAPFAGASLVHRAVGRLQHSRLDLPAAARSYERRIALTPLASDARLDLGAIYQSQDRLGAALAEFLIGAVIDPRSARAFAAIGQLQADRGEDEAALRMLRRAIELDATLLDARYAISRALLRLGRADEARQEMQVFERLQRDAMEAERRRFEENARAIEDALRAPEKGTGK